MATVLVVGFIGISSPSSIFAQYYDDDYESEYSQYYDDDYEKSYDKYMKDDYSQTSKKNIKINCDNSNYNPPINVNVNIDNSDPTNGEVSSSSDASRSFSTGDSQSGQDRMNSNQKGNFKVICQNNNNVDVNPIFNTVKNIVNNNETIVNNIAETQANNVTATQSNSFTADITQDAENSGNGTLQQGFCLQVNQQNAAAGNDASNTGTNEIQSCQDTESNGASQDPTIGASSNDNVNGGIISSSVANSEDPQAQTQVKIIHNGNGVEINKQGNQPIDIREIQSSNNSNEKDSSITSQSVDDSSELTAMEKITKLKTQWLNQLP
ncbi:MAG TPA: hypothetical protein VFK40_11910 [Nitrososphaeraceae archaeon]|nr:hypothetical protein [Nitrososphaeraceae archaeon]